MTISQLAALIQGIQGKPNQQTKPAAAPQQLAVPAPAPPQSPASPPPSANQLSFISPEESAVLMQAVAEGDADKFHAGLNSIGAAAYRMSTEDATKASSMLLDERESTRTANQQLEAQTQQLVNALISDAGYENNEQTIAMATGLLQVELSKPGMDLEKAVAGVQTSMSYFTPQAAKQETPEQQTEQTREQELDLMFGEQPESAAPAPAANPGEAHPGTGIPLGTPPAE